MLKISTVIRKWCPLWRSLWLVCDKMVAIVMSWDVTSRMWRHVKNAQVKLLCFFQCSSAMKLYRDVCCLPALCCGQRETRKRICSFDCVWGASWHMRNIINWLVISIYQTETVKFWLFQSTAISVKFEPSSAKLTIYTQNARNKISLQEFGRHSIINPIFSKKPKNPLKLKRFRVFTF